jgi:AdoMet-dependent rRNA methyltransferase SPB1
MAMRMVQDGRRQQRNILDEYGYNRDIFHDDPDSLPKWFLEDEVQHRRRQLPVTKEAAQLLRERQKELNARPIKKVLEAKSRKKYKAMKKLEKVREKMNSLVADGSPENGDDPELGTKLGQAQSMLQRAKQKAKQMMRRKVEVVVARGGNRGNPGRPKGVKGRYKMVDNRMKKEVRAEKRRTQTQRRR